MTKKINKQEKNPLNYSEKEKQILPMPNELDPTGHGVQLKIASAAFRMKGRLSSSKFVSEKL